MLKILGRVSSINVRKALWCLDELGLGYEREDWGAGFRSAQSAEYLQWNPNGQIRSCWTATSCSGSPTASCATGQRPWRRGAVSHRTARARARVDQWLDWQACELNPAWSYAYLALVKQQPPEPDPQRLGKASPPGTGASPFWRRTWRSTAPTWRRTFQPGRLAGPVAARWRSTPIERNRRAGHRWPISNAWPPPGLGLLCERCHAL